LTLALALDPRLTPWATVWRPLRELAVPPGAGGSGG